MPLKLKKVAILVLTCVLIFNSCTAKTVGTQPASTPIETKAPIANCLPISSPRSAIKGGLLFYEFGGAKQPGIARLWYWSSGRQLPKRILEQDLIETSVLHLSPDGQKIAWDEYGSEQFTVYDLVSRTHENLPWNDNWQKIDRWTEDGLVAIRESYQENYGEGISIKYAFFDLQSKTFTAQTLTYDLPGYTSDALGYSPLFGFTAFDPTMSLVVYIGDFGEKNKMVLRDTKSHKSLWAEETQYPYYPVPVWTLDGNRVAFVINRERPIIYTSTRDGKAIEAIGEGQKQRPIRNIKWSPDGNYLYYSNWTTINDGPAYIIDVNTKETREICTPGHLVLDGIWLPENHFAYTVREGEKPHQDGIAELRLLNVEDWTFQTLFRTSSKVGPTTQYGYELKILGWTPASIP